MINLGNHRQRFSKDLVVFAMIGLTTVISACGGGASPGPTGAGGSGTVFFLIPNATTPAWPTYYMPAVQSAFKKYLPNFKLVTESADNDQAKQLSQVEAAITQQAAAVIISPPNPAQAGAELVKLGAAKIPAVAYLNDPNGGPVNSYVWVDYASIGKYWGQWLTDNLEKKVGHTPVRLAAIYGDPTFKVYDLWLQGIKPQLDSLVSAGKVKIVCQADSTGWAPAVAQKAMEQCLTQNTDKVDATLAMNDSTSDGIWAALRSRGLNGKVTMIGGHDGSLTAVQRVLVGDQVATFHADGVQLGEATANLVLAALAGKTPQSTGFINGTFDNGYVKGGVPTVFGKENLITPDIVQKEIVDNKIFTKDEICQGIAAKSTFCTS